VNVRGLSAISRRTAAGKALFRWKQDLEAALGGRENISPQKAALVDAIARTQLYVAHVDNFIMEQPSLVNRRRKAIVPILRERQVLVDSLARLLNQIGLERVPVRIPSLAEYLEKKEASRGDANDS